MIDYAKIKKDIDQKGFSLVDKNFFASEFGSDANIIDLTNSKVAGSFSDLQGKKNPKYVYRNCCKDSWFVFNREECNLQIVTDLIQFIGLVMSLENTASNRYFRGQKASYDLMPSLFRKKEWVQNEMEINARIYCDRHNDFLDCNSTFEKLVRLKHYNQPSRLLDLTANPLVALFFACYDSNKNENESIGVVYEAFCQEDKEKISVSSDTVTMLTAMTNTKISKDVLNGNGRINCKSRGFNKKCSFCCRKGLINRCKHFNSIRSINLQNDWSKKYIEELTHQCKKEGMSIYWDDLCFPKLDQCILVKPPLNTDRIVRQSGCFIMCGMNIDDIYSPPEALYDFFKSPTGGKRNVYYILPCFKSRILEQLKVLGIDEYFIYPELEREIDSVKNSYLKGK